MSAWGTVATTKPTITAGGLMEIMGEQLATKLETEELISTVQSEQGDEWVTLQADQEGNKLETEKNELTSLEQKGGQEHEETVPGSTSLDEDFALALRLQAEETAGVVPSPKPETSSTTNHDDDFALALRLQEEERLRALDEYNVHRNESRHLSQGKVFVRPRPLPQNLVDWHSPQSPSQAQSDDAHDDDSDDEFGMGTQVRQAAKPRGPFWATRDKTLKGQGGDKEIITKHDMELSGRHGVKRITKDLPSTAMTGDLDIMSGASGSRLKLHHSVVNTLQQQVKKQSGMVKGLGRTVEKDSRQTHAKGLDHRTRLILHRLVNSCVLDELNGVVRTGKEATVYHATGSGVQQSEAAGVSPGVKGKTAVVHREENGSVFLNPSLASKEAGKTREFAVKVFRTTLGGFKNRKSYVDGDHRFASYGDLKRQNPLKIVRVWAEKEFKNLARIHHAGIPSPEPWRLHENVLIMEFIGRDGWPAPQLKETHLTRKKLERCFIQIVLMVRAMYHKCALVHADLSEYNILYFDSQCMLIDVGQSVELGHPEAHAFLTRDCNNVVAYFSSKGLVGLPSGEDLYKFVTAKEENGSHGVDDEDGFEVVNTKDLHCDTAEELEAEKLLSTYQWACSSSYEVQHLSDFMTSLFNPQT